MAILVASHTHNSHSVAPTLKTDGMATLQGLMDMSAQCVKRHIQQAVVLPVVWNGYINLLIIR